MEEEAELSSSSVALFDESEFAGMFLDQPMRETSLRDASASPVNIVATVSPASTVNNARTTPLVGLRTSSIQIDGRQNAPKSLASFAQTTQNLQQAFLGVPQDSKTIAELKDQINRLEQDNVTLVEELDSVSARECQLAGLKLALEKDNEKLKSDLEAKTVEIKELACNISRMEGSKNMLLSKAGKSDMLQSEYDKLQKDFEDLRISRSAFVEEVSDLKMEVSRLSTELSRARNQNSSIINDLQSLQDENEVLRAARSGENNSSSRWEHRVRELEALNRRLEDQLRDLRGDMSDQSVSRDRNLEDLERKVRQLENELSTTRRAHHEEITLLQRESKRWNGSNSVAMTSSSKPYDYANADLSGRSYSEQANASTAFPETSAREIFQGYDKPYGRYDMDVRPTSRANLDEDMSLLTRPKPSYLDPELPAPPITSTRTGNSSGTSLSSLQPSSRTQTLGALRQSLASVVQTAESIGRSYPNVPQVEPRGSRSLSELYQSQQQEQSSAGSYNAIQRSNSARRKRPQDLLGSKPTPFATESTSVELMEYEVLEKNLTKLMTEKASLDNEIEKLHQRGGKMLSERTRSVQVEARLSELSKEIGSIRRQLTSKPN